MLKRVSCLKRCFFCNWCNYHFSFIKYDFIDNDQSIFIITFLSKINWRPLANSNTNHNSNVLINVFTRMWRICPFSTIYFDYSLIANQCIHIDIPWYWIYFKCLVNWIIINPFIKKDCCCCNETQIRANSRRVIHYNYMTKYWHVPLL